MKIFQNDIDFASMKALVIDDAATSRMAMKSQLHQSGVNDVAVASNVNEARRALGCKESARSITPYYDIILCDYFMGDGLNGQDVLEELRCTGKLKNAQVFFMITAESAYQTVAEVAEYCPDDYLLKPITSARLSERLDAAIRKKRIMKPVYKAFEAKQWNETIVVGTKLIKENGLSVAHAIEARRFIAQAMTELGQLDAAKKVYSSVAEKYGIPWAKFGLVQIKVIEGDLDNAMIELENLIAGNPKYMSAIDLNINLHEKRLELQKAFEMSVQALESTPNNVSRLQKAGSIASTMGSDKDAEKYFSRVLKIGMLSPSLSPRTFLQLAISKMRLNNTKEVGEIIEGLNTYLNDNPKTPSKVIFKRLGVIVDEISRDNYDLAFDLINEMHQFVMADDFTWECCQDYLQLLLIIYNKKFGNEISESNINGISLENPILNKTRYCIDKIVKRFSGTKQLYDCIMSSIKSNVFLTSMAKTSNDEFEKVIQSQMINIAKKNFTAAAEAFESLAAETKNEWLASAALRARAKISENKSLVA